MNIFWEGKLLTPVIFDLKKKNFVTLTFLSYTCYGVLKLTIGLFEPWPHFYLADLARPKNGCTCNLSFWINFKHTTHIIDYPCGILAARWSNSQFVLYMYCQVLNVVINDRLSPSWDMVIVTHVVVTLSTQGHILSCLCSTTTEKRLNDYSTSSLQQR
jgi:hypothetical protein